MKGAWIERASILSNLLHTNSTGQTCGYFPACSLTVIHVEKVQQMDEEHSLRVSNFLFLFPILSFPFLSFLHLQVHVHKSMLALHPLSGYHAVLKIMMKNLYRMHFTFSPI